MKRAWLLAPALLLAFGCVRSAPASAPVAAAAVPPPAEALDRLDGRTPLPLLPRMANHQKENMRDHLLAVQEIVAAIATEDYAAIEKAAGRIGFSEEMGQMCNHMGAGAPGFTAQALHFHHTADRIATAARERDRTRVLTELGATLQTCNACHATFKQQIVDEAMWRQKTSSPAPAHGTAK